MRVIQMYYPSYRGLQIHESSPGNRGVSPKLQNDCIGYSTSHYFPGVEPGEIDQSTGYMCQNLESLLYEDESFDLFITQDVMEHIFEPSKAFKEIARVLKPGGAHIFTVPIINKADASECWASKDDSGEVIYHREAEYHGNPIDSSGSLVTMHWGYDIAEFIQKKAALQRPLCLLTICRWA